MVCFIDCSWWSICFFVFKQKTAYEMRISDGVQTCALPIYRAHDDAIAVAAVDRAGEAAVDLEIVDRQPREQREAGIAGAEIVDGDRDAERADLRQQIGRASCRESVCQSV